MSDDAGFLLDTNILSDLIRYGREGRVASALAERDAEVATSIVVAAEIRYGVARKNSKRLAERAEVVLAAITILPFGTLADRHYGEIRALLERAGTPIGPNDLMIAAQCRALGLTLVSANLDEFRRVPGLRVENWLAA